jgi:hypothetical protein
MPYLTLPTAGELRVLAFKRLPDERGGSPKRTLSGSLRGDPLWTARSWEAQVLCTSDTEASAVYADADPFADRSLSGDLLGGTVIARLEVTGDGHQFYRSAWDRVLTLLIREQVSP